MMWNWITLNLLTKQGVWWRFGAGCVLRAPNRTRGTNPGAGSVANWFRSSCTKLSNAPQLKSHAVFYLSQITRPEAWSTVFVRDPTFEIVKCLTFSVISRSIFPSLINSQLKIFPQITFLSNVKSENLLFFLLIVQHFASTMAKWLLMKSRLNWS